MRPEFCETTKYLKTYTYAGSIARIWRVAASQDPSQDKPTESPKTANPGMIFRPCKLNELPYKKASCATGRASTVEATATSPKAIKPPPNPYQTPLYRNGRRVNPSEAPTSFMTSIS